MDQQTKHPILGKKVKDRITGFSGIAVNRTEFLTGCNRIGVQPEVKEDGKLPEAKGFDILSLEIMDDEKIDIEENEEKGGDLDFMPEQKTVVL